MAGYVLAPETTVSSATGASLTQDAYYWLNLEGFSDAAFFIECMDVSGSVNLHIESAPAPDEMLFGDVCPPIVLAPSASPIVRKTVRTPSTRSLSRNVRWRLDSSSGAWSATFRIRAVPLRSRSFVPTDIAGCQLWLRSDLGISLGSGGGIATWADQSGNGRDASAAFGQQPGFTASSINNLPSVDCDGTTSLLATTAFNVGTYTVLMVATGQDVIPGVTNIGYFWTRSAAAVNHDTLYGTTTNTTEVNRGGSLSAYNYSAGWGSWGATTARVLAQLFDGTHSGHRLRMNGAELALSNVSNVDPGTAATSDQFVIAARNDGFLRSKIKVAEVVVYDHSLAADDLARVEQYLRRRYALY